MNYQIIRSPRKYLEVISGDTPIATENDALQLVALGAENNTDLLMIHYGALAEDFFNLKTKTAGNILQKFINYRIKAVAVIPKEIIQKGRFREFVLEINKGQSFRVYETREAAETWLLQ